MYAAQQKKVGPITQDLPQFGSRLDLDLNDNDNDSNNSNGQMFSPVVFSEKLGIFRKICRLTTCEDRRSCIGVGLTPYTIVIPSVKRWELRSSQFVRFGPVYKAKSISICLQPLLQILRSTRDIKMIPEMGYASRAKRELVVMATSPASKQRTAKTETTARSASQREQEAAFSIFVRGGKTARAGPGATEVEEIVDVSEPMNIDSDAKMDIEAPI
ncbi:hypothetical protein TNCV_1173491 [Trichonephila clavipes]|uniref:Uncharacterized protein n=1 Tax=Trichonephila clavipes TaxID=2585209 RepID=A0A8X6S089_TRICX|nr:hypothetical protein TNCV_1173491 [Trichonephila clavipes]